MKCTKKILLLIIGLIALNINITVYAEDYHTLNYYNEKNETNIEKMDNKYRITGTDTSKRSLSCNQLIDSETKKLLNDFLKYPRFIVPAILITLGSIDFFKATVAGKEDEMKKAQKTFLKRVIAGVAVFLVPAIVNIIIWFANIAWQGLGYTTCPF